MVLQDHSAARGEMATRGLYVFSHESSLGNAPAHRLFDGIDVHLRTEGAAPPRRFRDYEVTVNQTLPEGVTLTVLEG